MNRLAAQAAELGIETEHYDALGRRWAVEPSVIEKIVEAVSVDGQPRPLETKIAPRLAFQGTAALPRRSWALAAQLYSIRSNRNWGHGDFTDLVNLIELAATLGVSAIGLNPLHALFGDRPQEASPYFPSSRLFLNPLYIDVEVIPEFPRDMVGQMSTDIGALRRKDLVDYQGVAELKQRAFSIAYDHFRRHGLPERQRSFEQFQRARGTALAQFAAFELLRRRFDRPWHGWPAEWRKPEPQALSRLRESEGEKLAYYEFLQWIADEQLGACRDRARQLGLPIGLYLDLAVGVRADGFDAWSDSQYILSTIEIGAPPDLLNTHGQAWGLAGFNPFALCHRDCAPFKEVLRALMRYAGAIRLDHILGLKRLYFIPQGRTAEQGAYVRFPFEAQLAAAVAESAASECIVIGEDLGNVPPGLRETLAAWGIWSYQVMMFERAADGGFIAPGHYRENALVTFGTHDLATFAGWCSGYDLAVKKSLGLDPGETESERGSTKEALQRTMAWRGLPDIDFLSIMKFLSDTPCRLLMVNLEDALGVKDQVNLPGTTTQHPNWLGRLPVDLENLAHQSSLMGVAEIMCANGRRSPTRAT